jgi:adenylylsulfate kinase
MIIILTGLSGAGKTTLSAQTKNFLSGHGLDIEVIDGDEYRKAIGKDLGFSKEDRMENIRRLAFIAGKFSARGIVTIISAINPYKESRDELISSYPDVLTVHVDCPLAVLITRDTKGLYKRSQLNDDHPDKISNLTGINDQYDKPVNPDLYINTNATCLADCTLALGNFILGKLKSSN